MRTALTGYMNSGKTTILKAVCDSFAETSTEKGRLRVRLGVAKIPDARLDKIAELYKSPKITPSEMLFNDFQFTPDDSGERKALDDMLIAQLKMADALVYVCRGFENKNVFYRFDEINPLRDAQELQSDMIITDLVSAERRIERLEFELKKGKKEMEPEYALINRLKDQLDKEQPLRKLEITPDERKAIRGFGFLTQKNVVLLINAEDDGTFPGNLDEINDWAHSEGMSVMVLRGRLQADLREMDESEQEDFMREMNIPTTALVKLIKEVYKSVGVIHFFTGGDDEARSWEIRRGSTAWDAAAAIHTDIQDRFIRADVMSYDDFVKYGSEKACKDAGVYRTEKKEYLVKDGDLMFFRHS